MILPVCPTCQNTGEIEVSYADPENGPTNNPEDERGTEPCDCPVGYQRWYTEAERSDKAAKEFFASIGL